MLVDLRRINVVMDRVWSAEVCREIHTWLLISAHSEFCIDRRYKVLTDDIPKRVPVFKGDGYAPHRGQSHTTISLERLASLEHAKVQSNAARILIRDAEECTFCSLDFVMTA